MPQGSRSSSSRSIGVLLAGAILIAMAGLAALGATAIWNAADSGEDSGPLPTLRPARFRPIGHALATAPLARSGETAPLARNREISR